MTLDEAAGSVGRIVIYRRGAYCQQAGRITSVNDTYAFVRYAREAHAKATRPEDLSLWLPRATNLMDAVEIERRRAERDRQMQRRIALAYTNRDFPLPPVSLLTADNRHYVNYTCSSMRRADEPCCICGELVAPGTGGHGVGPFPSIHTKCLKRLEAQAGVLADVPRGSGGTTHE